MQECLGIYFSLLHLIKMLMKIKRSLEFIKSTSVLLRSPLHKTAVTFQVFQAISQHVKPTNGC